MTITMEKPGTETVRRKKASMAEAVALVEKSDLKIKGAAKNRLQVAKDPSVELEIRTIHKAGISSMATIASSVPVAGLLFGMEAGIDYGLTAMFVPVVLFAFVGIFHKTPTMQKALSPMRFKKLHQEVALSEKMHEMKEQEFALEEAKQLKKTRKSLKIINGELDRDGKMMVYDNTFGNEGFHVCAKDQESLTQWEELHLKAINVQAQNALAQTEKKIIES